MANKFKGEFDITLDGKTYTMRPTFEAMVDFEDKAGSVVNWAKLMGEQTPPSIKAIVAAIWAGIKHGHPVDGRPPSFSEVGAMVMRDGAMKHAPTFVNFLAKAMSLDGDIAQAQQDAAAGKAEGAATT